MGTIKKMMAKLLKDTNAPWLEYADDYQSDCAFIYFWFNNLAKSGAEGLDNEADDFFKAGLDASPDYQGGVDIWFKAAGPKGARPKNGPTIIREFWADKKWQWVKFWDATDIASAPSTADEFRKEHREFGQTVRTVLEAPIETKFLEFAEPWIDVKDSKALKEFYNKYYDEAFKKAWITEIRKAAPTDEDIFGNIWNLDASPDPVDDIKEEDEPEDQDEKITTIEEKLTFGGRTAWVNEIDGEIKLSKNSPGDAWMLIESVNTGDIGADGEILFVPSVLEGVKDWWIGLGHSDSDINTLSKTKIIIAGAGDYSKSWLRRYFFVKDKDGNLVISY